MKTLGIVILTLVIVVLIVFAMAGFSVAKKPALKPAVKAAESDQELWDWIKATS